jgi:hypothetical protein
LSEMDLDLVKSRCQQKSSLAPKVTAISTKLPKTTGERTILKYRENVYL